MARAARTLMHFSKSPQPAAFVNLQSRQYPVTIEGKGSIPCLSIGIGTLMQRTLSNNFKSKFKVYSTDSYWVKQGALARPTDLTIDAIVEDVLLTAKQLNLGNDYILMGNSCFGIIAIEAARKAKLFGFGPRGVLAVAAAPCWNDAMIAKADAHFHKTADAKRIADHKARRAKFEASKKPGESEVSLNGYEADSAKYWEDYHITRPELEELWQGVEADDAIMNHFFGKLLPEFDLGQRIGEVTVPVAVLGGETDYDSIPFELWPTFPKPKTFALINCGKTGHWPHYENAQVFDQQVEQWYMKNILKAQELKKVEAAAGSSSNSKVSQSKMWTSAAASAAGSTTTATVSAAAAAAASASATPVPTVSPITGTKLTG